MASIEDIVDRVLTSQSPISAPYHTGSSPANLSTEVTSPAPHPQHSLGLSGLEVTPLARRDDEPSSAGRYGSARNSSRFASARGMGAEEYNSPLQPTQTIYHTDDTSIPALRRMELWRARRDNRMDQLREETEAKVAADCPFTPNLNTSLERRRTSDQQSLLYKDNKAWGFEEHIERVHAAKARRDDQKRYEEDYWSSPGRNWKRQETIPEPFELGRRPKLPHKKAAAISSLKTSFDTCADKVRHLHTENETSIEPPAVPSGLFSMHASSVIMQHSPQKRRQMRTPQK